jgi:hypothetical protein
MALVEGLHLAHGAAEVGVAVVEPGPVLGVLLVDAQHGQDGPDLDAFGVVVAGFEGLGEVVAGVEEEHVEAGRRLRDQLHQHLVAHRRRDGDMSAPKVCSAHCRTSRLSFTLPRWPA